MYFFVKMNTTDFNFILIFFCHIINEWNKFDSNICSYYLEYCNAFLKFIGPVETKIFNVSDYNGLKKFIGI